MSKNGSNSNERLFFEIKGKQGRIYLEGVSFGGFSLGVDGHSSAFVRTPANLFPEGHGVIWEPLHRVLEQYYRNVRESQYANAGSNLYETGFQECTIGVETKMKGQAVTRPKYRLLQVRVVDIYRTPKQGAHSQCYVFDFGDYQRF